MSKAHEKKNLFGQRTLLAVSLAASMTAFGCTTDRQLGNGDPVVTPGLRTTPTSSPTSGSESAPTSPMFSSSRFADTSIRNGAPAMNSPAGTAAVLADLQPRVRTLGQTTGGVTPPGYYGGSQVTGQFQNPAVVTNPQLTVNSTISSAPVPVINSAGGAGGGGGVSAGVVVGGTTGAAVIGGTGSVATTVAPGTFAPGPSPTAASAGTPSPGAFANGPSPTAASAVTPAAGATSSRVLSPTAASAATPPAGISASPTLAALASRRTAAAATVNGTPVAIEAAPATTTPAATRTNATASGTVRVTTDANGRAVVTNTTTSKEQ